jgi:hypothetical protein
MVTLLCVSSPGCSEFKSEGRLVYINHVAREEASNSSCLNLWAPLNAVIRTWQNDSVPPIELELAHDSRTELFW